MRKDRDGFRTWYAISFALQLGFLIVVPVGGFMFLGMLGDRTFHSFPLFFVIGIGVGLSITVYEIYHLLILLVKNDHD